MKLTELFPEKNSVPRRAAAEGTRVPRGAEVGNRQILLNGHVRRGAEQRVLKQAPDDAAPLVLRHKGDIQIVQKNLAVIHIEAARNRSENSGLAGAKSPSGSVSERPFSAIFSLTVPSLKVFFKFETLSMPCLLSPGAAAWPPFSGGAGQGRAVPPAPQSQLRQSEPRPA